MLKKRSLFASVSFFVMSFFITANLFANDVDPDSVSNLDSSKRSINGLQVLDCKGNMRLSHNLDEASTVGIAVQLEKKLAVDQEAVLKPNLIVDAAISAKESNDGSSLVFESVSAGSWSLCDEDGEEVKFSSIKVISEEDIGFFKTSDDGTVTAGAAILGVGGAALAGSSAAFSGSSSRELAGTISPDGGSVILDPIANGDTGSVAPSATGNDQYDFGAPGSPLSPFR